MHYIQRAQNRPLAAKPLLSDDALQLGTDKMNSDLQLMPSFSQMIRYLTEEALYRRRKCKY